MLTNFVLNQNNILSNYSKPQPVKSQLSNKQVEKIVKQQDIVVNRFVNTLDNNIQNYLIGNIGKKDINLFLPIKNALWQLWNESWLLGQVNAAEELRAVKFSSGDSLVTFAKRESDEVKKDKAIKKLDSFNEQYKTNGKFDENKILKVIGKKRNSITDKQLANIIKQLEKDEDKLNEKVTGVRTRPFKFPSNDSSNKAYEQVQQLREQQENVKPPNLENTNFGKAYLDQRFSTIANVSKESFNQSFSTRLNEIIPDYFNDNRSDKDRSYVTKIRRMYISDTRNIDEYKNKDAVLSSIITSYEQPEIIDRTGIIKREIFRLQEELRGKSIKQKQLYFDRINELKKELTNEPKRIKQEIAKSEDKSKQFISISQEDKEKLGLTKNSYSIKELEKIRSDVRKQIRQQDQNFYNTKRIALTELNAAYNLGRLDYYQNNNIDYVRWEVSVEHKYRELNSANKNDAGTIRSYNAKGNYGALAGKYQGVVCPVCWERNGKVYSISEITSNAELQIPVHPFCACILVPVKDDDDDNPKKKKKFKVKTSDLLNNSVLKWAAGAGVAILGTAAMYAAFRMTRGKVVQPTVIDQTPQVTKIIPKPIKAPNYIKRIADETIDTIIENEEQILKDVRKKADKVAKKQINKPSETTTNKPINIVDVVDELPTIPNDPPSIIDVARENQDEILEQLPSKVNDVIEDSPIALPELQPKRPNINIQPKELTEEYVYVDAVPLNIPTETVDITPYNTQVNTAISQDYLDEVGDVLEYAIQQRNNFNTINPASVVSSSTRNELDDIASRLEQYKEYLSSAATKADKDAIIKQYRNDIRQVNNIINKYEQDNVLIYTEMRTLMSLRNEGITRLGNTLGNVDDDIATIFGSTNIGRRINDELVDLERILINRYDDLNAELGGYYKRAKRIKDEISNANPRLTLDYLRKIKGNLTKSLTKIKPNEFNVNDVSDRLMQLEEMLSKVNKIGAEDFFYYSDRLEQLTTYVKQFEKQITNTLLDVDLKTLIKQLEGSRNPDNDLLTAAIILSDYKDTIRQTYNKINGLNVNLILKFNS